MGNTTVAYAIAITEDNIRGIILSEGGLKFDLDRSLMWLEEYKQGWFLRNEGSVFDCHFFAPEIFEEMYFFVKNDPEALIRHVKEV